MTKNKFYCTHVLLISNSILLQNTQNEEFYILFHSTANCVCGIKITLENVAFCSFHLFTISIQTKEFKFRL